jgi:threonine dehydrogenase-like Zn-dependent dehydrogenase
MNAAPILPTAWQAVEYADGPAGGTVAVWGLGPVGQLCARIARHVGAVQVFGIDSVPERLNLAQRHGISTRRSYARPQRRIISCGQGVVGTIWSQAGPTGPQRTIR